MTTAQKNPVVIFMPAAARVEVDSGTKILVAARQASIPIRFMCASLRCGTCGVQVECSNGTLTAAAEDELAMLRRLKLPLDGTVRMACRARIQDGEVAVDLNFQDSYDPGDNSDFEDV